MSQKERVKTTNVAGTYRGKNAKTQARGYSAVAKGAKRKVKAPIGSVAHLIRKNYELKTGVRRLRKADVQAILSTPGLDGSDRTELLELARADATLQQTKQLLLLSARTEAPKIANGLREFGRQVLASHPLFQGMTMREILANLASTPMDSAVAALASTDGKELNRDGEKPLPKSQIERIRANAVHCLVLLLRASQRASLRRIQRALQEYLWAPKARRHRTESEKLEALLAARDPIAASVTFTVLDEEAMLQGQRAEAAARGEQRAQTKVQRLEQQVVDLERRLHETAGQCAELRGELHEERQSHSATDARWRDTYETLKGRTLNRLMEESSLLEEGLHALKREPPKVRVMIDHAARAIEGLKGEAEQIRRGTAA